MASIRDQVFTRLRAKGRGAVFGPTDFLDLGSRAAVDQALSRLARSGKIRRLARGVYDYPKTHPRFGVLSPSLDRVAAAIARATGSTIQLSGAHAANLLGLSTQIPAHLLYLTDGPPRKVRIGNQMIDFRHAAPRKLAGAGTPAGTVLQALQYLGRAGMTDDLVRRLQHTLDPADKASLSRHARSAPAWARPAITQIAEAG
jgi:hypothetical protein